MDPSPKYYKRSGDTTWHQVRAALALGKPLPPKAVIHHGDGTRSEKSPLVICEDQKYHGLLHVRTRVLRAGGNPNTQRICYTCKQLVDITDFPSTYQRLEKWYACKPCKKQRDHDAHVRRRARMAVA